MEAAFPLRSIIPPNTGVRNSAPKAGRPARYRDVFGYVVFRHHQFGSEFLEGEYTRIEQDTQEGNEPESRIADYGHHILEGEFFIIAAGGVDRDLAVELAVHESEA